MYDIQIVFKVIFSITYKRYVISPYPKGYYPVTGLTFLPQFA